MVWSADYLSGVHWRVSDPVVGKLSFRVHWRVGDAVVGRLSFRVHWRVDDVVVWSEDYLSGYIEGWPTSWYGRQTIFQGTLEGGRRRGMVGRLSFRVHWRVADVVVGRLSFRVHWRVADVVVWSADYLSGVHWRVGDAVVWSEDYLLGLLRGRTTPLWAEEMPDGQR